jgi:hypothetical protein
MRPYFLIITEYEAKKAYSSYYRLDYLDYLLEKHCTTYENNLIFTSLLI